MLGNELPSYIHQRLRCARSIITTAATAASQAYTSSRGIALASHSDTTEQEGLGQGLGLDGNRSPHHHLRINDDIETRNRTIHIDTVDGRDKDDVVFSCDSMLIRANADFRLLIPRVSLTLPAMLRWEFNVPKLMNQSKHVIGFSVLVKKSDGSFPQLVPYKYD